MHDYDQLAAYRSNSNTALAPPQGARPMTTDLPRPASPTARTVIECYDFLDRFLPECGILDLTDGLYHGDPGTPHEQAQQKQVEWLLDQATGGQARDGGAEGAARITLEVRASNFAAQELYRRFGFEAVALRRGYYQDSGEDALVMMRDLGAE